MKKNRENSGNRYGKVKGNETRVSRGSRLPLVVIWLKEDVDWEGGRPNPQKEASLLPAYNMLQKQLRFSRTDFCISNFLELY
jgi:hypothetical protein